MAEALAREVVADGGSALGARLGRFASALSGRHAAFGGGASIGGGGVLAGVSRRWLMPSRLEQGIEVFTPADLGGLAHDWSPAAGYAELGEGSQGPFVVPVDPVQHPQGFAAAAMGRRRRGAMRTVRPERAKPAAPLVAQERWRAAGEKGLSPYPAAMGAPAAILPNLLRFPEARAEVHGAGGRGVLVEPGAAPDWAPEASLAPAAQAAERWGERVIGRLEAPQKRDVSAWLLPADASPTLVAQASARAETRRPGRWQAARSGASFASVSGPQISRAADAAPMATLLRAEDPRVAGALSPVAAEGAPISPAGAEPVASPRPMRVTASPREMVRARPPRRTSRAWLPSTPRPSRPAHRRAATRGIESVDQAGAPSALPALAEPFEPSTAAPLRGAESPAPLPAPAGRAPLPALTRGVEAPLAPSMAGAIGAAWAEAGAWLPGTEVEARPSSAASWLSTLAPQGVLVEALRVRQQSPSSAGEPAGLPALQAARATVETLARSLMQPSATPSRSDAAAPAGAPSATASPSAAASPSRVADGPRRLDPLDATLVQPVGPEPSAAPPQPAARQLAPQTLASRQPLAEALTARLAPEPTAETLPALAAGGAAVERLAAMLLPEATVSQARAEHPLAEGGAPGPLLRALAQLGPEGPMLEALAGPLSPQMVLAQPGPGRAPTQPGEASAAPGAILGAPPIAPAVARMNASPPAILRRAPAALLTQVLASPLVQRALQGPQGARVMETLAQRPELILGLAARSAEQAPADAPAEARALTGRRVAPLAATVAQRWAVQEEAAPAPSRLESTSGAGVLFSPSLQSGPGALAAQALQSTAPAIARPRPSSPRAVTPDQADPPQRPQRARIRGAGISASVARRTESPTRVVVQAPHERFAERIMEGPPPTLITSPAPEETEARPEHPVVASSTPSATLIEGAAPSAAVSPQPMSFAGTPVAQAREILRQPTRRSRRRAPHNVEAALQTFERAHVSAGSPPLPAPPPTREQRVAELIAPRVAPPAPKPEEAEAAGRLPTVAIPVHLCGQPCAPGAVYCYFSESITSLPMSAPSHFSTAVFASASASNSTVPVMPVTGSSSVTEKALTAPIDSICPRSPSSPIIGKPE